MKLPQNQKHEVCFQSGVVTDIPKVCLVLYTVQIDASLKKSVKRELIKLSDNAHLLMVLKVMAD